MMLGEVCAGIMEVWRSHAKLVNHAQLQVFCSVTAEPPIGYDEPLLSNGMAYVSADFEAALAVKYKCTIPSRLVS